MEILQENVFDARDVSFRYNDVTALDGLSLAIKKNQRIAILGANGSGKSTFLRLLDALYFPDSGSISAFGETLSEAAFEDEQFAFAFRRRVAFVFQNPDVQLFNPTVFDEVAFAPLQLRWSKTEIKRRVNEILETMEIAHLKDRAPHRLSGGEKKRVALASVLILDPAILLLDEPTAALDPKSQSQVVDFLVGWGEAGAGKTVVTATHDLDIVADIADYCFVFQNGKVAGEGTPAQILADSELLEKTNLIHAHRHVHADGSIHKHPHSHRFHEHG